MSEGEEKSIAHELSVFERETNGKKWIENVFLFWSYLEDHSGDDHSKL